jgi:hypothetical protein
MNWFLSTKTPTGIKTQNTANMMIEGNNPATSEAIR